MERRSESPCLPGQTLGTLPTIQNHPVQFTIGAMQRDATREPDERAGSPGPAGPQHWGVLPLAPGSAGGKEPLLAQTWEDRDNVDSLQVLLACLLLGTKALTAVGRQPGLSPPGHG